MYMFRNSECQFFFKDCSETNKDMISDVKFLVIKRAADEMQLPTLSSRKFCKS